MMVSNSRRSGRMRAAMVAALVATTALATAVPGIAMAQAGSATQIDIAAQPLDSGLRALMRATGVSIAYPAELSAGKQGGAVAGTLGAAEALSRLLVGTGLTYRQTGPRSFTIERAPQSSDGAVELGPVRVEGGGAASFAGGDSISSDPGATEGTGSYTTRSMNSATGMRLSIRETPQSVSVLTRAQMDNDRILTLEDAIASIPGMTTVQGDFSGDSAMFMARGFSLDTILIDGMAVSFGGSGSYNGQTDDMAIYDRVEVLRGANGLMQGTGSPSASINLIRKRPTREPQILLTGSVGSWNNYRLDVDVAGPINDGGTLRGRFVAAYGDRDSFIDVVHYTTRLAYGVIEADLGEHSILTVGGSWRDFDHDGMHSGIPDNEDGSVIPLPRSTYVGADYNYEKTRHKSLFAELRHQLGGDWEVKASAQIQNMDADFVESSIYRRDGVLRLVPQAYAYQQRRASADVRATGSFTLFGRQHDMALGVNWQRQHRSGNGGWGEGNWTATGGTAFDVYDFDSSAFTMGYVDRSLWTYGGVTTQTGLYGSVKLNPMDGVGLILGSRVSFYKNEDDRNPTSSFSRNGIYTPYAGVTWEFVKNHSVYASYTQIFEPQTARDRNDGLLPPITGTNYEAGVKGEYLDGALNLTASIFLMRQRNRAMDDLNSSNPCTPTRNGWCQRAAGEVESKGFELELAGQLTQGWAMSAGYTFANATYRKDDDAALVGTRYDATTPKHQIKLSTNYELPGALRDWTIGGSARFQSTTKRGGWGNSYLYLDGQSAYILLSAMVSRRIAPDWRLTLNVDNILDKTYYAGLGWGVTGRIYGEPRSAMLTLRGNF